MALTQVNQGLLSTDAQYTGFKNRIINGAMVIDQRNAGASVTAGDAFPVDRWAVENATDGSYSAQQSSTAPAGFNYSTAITITSADSSLAATQRLLFYQKIEGFNVADLGWGTADASPVTLSFKVRSSLTGTFGGSLQNSAQNRSYPFTYTISSANTWTTVSVTIAGDTSGTWLTTNGMGLRVTFGLGVGSTFSGTAGSWGGALYFSATGATSVVGTNGATFYITGVQLEKGSTATSFDYRPYTTEYQLCQRYFIKNTNFSVYGSGSMLTTTAAKIYFGPAQMRASPTSAYGSTGNQFRIYGGSAAYAVSSIDENNSTSDSLCSTYIISSALTVGWGVVGISPASSPSSWYVSFSAEL